MRLFINYAQADLAAIQPVADTLREAGHETTPADKLAPGADWAAELQTAIESADALIYALSPDSLAAEWCQWVFAKAVAAGKPIIPLLLRESASLPEAIQGFPVVDIATGFTDDDNHALLNALEHTDVCIVTVAQAVTAPEMPASIPAQAVGSLNIGRADAPAGLMLLPNVLNLLPPPFEWLEIRGGQVTLSDASEHGGSSGGTHMVGRFFIARGPVTNAQYRVFLEDPKGYSNDGWWKFSDSAKAWRQANPMPPAVAPDAEQAVIGVSWFEAVAFCRWLNLRLRPSLALANRDAASHRQPTEALPTITLPTEQQWQRAVENDAEQMDLTGNILEWCMTAWGSDNVLLGGEVARTLRVGSWEQDDVTRLRHRDLAKPDERDSAFGFRLACVLPNN